MDKFLESPIAQNVLSGIIIILLTTVVGFLYRYVMSKRPKFLLYASKVYSIPALQEEGNSYLTIIAIWNPGVEINAKDITVPLEIEYEQNTRVVVYGTNNGDITSDIKITDRSILLNAEKVGPKSGIIFGIKSKYQLVRIKGEINSEKIEQFSKSHLPEKLKYCVVLDGAFFGIFWIFLVSSGSILNYLFGINDVLAGLISLILAFVAFKFHPTPFSWWAYYRISMPKKIKDIYMDGTK